MKNFLWHLRGSIALNGTATDKETLDRIELLLKRQCKPASPQSNDCVAFNAPFWQTPFAANWHAMVIYDRGCFWIDDKPNRRLRYDLRSLHGFIFCFVVAAIFFVAGLAHGEVVWGIKFAGFALGWLYGMNVFLALLRVPRIIRQAALKS